MLSKAGLPRPAVDTSKRQDADTMRREYAWRLHANSISACSIDFLCAAARAGIGDMRATPLNAR